MLFSVIALIVIFACFKMSAILGVVVALLCLPLILLNVYTTFLFDEKEYCKQENERVSKQSKEETCEKTMKRRVGALLTACEKADVDMSAAKTAFDACE